MTPDTSIHAPVTRRQLKWKQIKWFPGVQNVQSFTTRGYGMQQIILSTFHIKLGTREVTPITNRAHGKPLQKTEFCRNKIKYNLVDPRAHYPVWIIRSQS
jgi:hypothetical protein